MNEQVITGYKDWGTVPSQGVHLNVSTWPNGRATVGHANMDADQLAAHIALCQRALNEIAPASELGERACQDLNGHTWPPVEDASKASKDMCARCGATRQIHATGGVTYTFGRPQVGVPGLPDIPYMGPLWYVARLRVRGPWSHGSHPTRVELDMTTAIKASGYPMAQRDAKARELAEAEFRRLGLGPMLDMEGARVRIEVELG